MLNSISARVRARSAAPAPEAQLTRSPGCPPSDSLSLCFYHSFKVDKHGDPLN
jgi:hypothetical protein